MTELRFACCDEQRRNAIDGHPTLNGIDYLEVGDLEPGELDAVEQAVYVSLPAGPQRDQLLWQRRLIVHFVNPLSVVHLAGLSGDTIRIVGGERVRGIRVALLPPSAQAAIALRASQAGDFSRYALELVRSAVDVRPPAGFDPILSRIDFSFKVDCPSEFDCRTTHVCLRQPVDDPDIDYLAKDYGSFRRLILDRLSLVLPDWRDRNPADLGVVIVELLTYVGDYLSYEQDAIATEAYLETARRRSSVRRHALLVDYAMHDGCNARAWLHVAVSSDILILPADLRCLTTVEGLPELIAPASPDEQTALNADAEWFEPIVAELDPASPPPPIALFADHDTLHFYTWGDDRCCLPRGATQATLLGHHPALARGMVVVFEEVKGPLTGDEADADRRHRHAVRLTKVVHTEDGAPLVDPLDDTPITTIRWDTTDALPFPLCVSARAEDGASVQDVSVAHGNIVLLDHGRSVTHDLGAPQPSRLSHAANENDRSCESEPRPIPARFGPALAGSPLTATGTVRKEIETIAGRESRLLRVDAEAPAAAAFGGEMRDVRPAITLESLLEGETTTWTAVRDLLDSAADAADFVVETEHDGVGHLRFGDDAHGRRPRTDESITARYRIGNGRAGNVGADAITHAVTLDARVLAVRNPLPARGGIDPETVEEVRRRAPQAFRTQERAVTPADYEAVVMRRPDVQRAAATLRWTGSWHTVFLTADRTDGRPLDDEIERELAGHVEPFRMAGHDLEFDDPHFVPLEVDLAVCVDPEYFRSDVKQRLLEVLSTRDLPDGRQGLFHPDAFTFGQTIHLSPILAAAREVPGVSAARVVTFQRQGVPESQSLDAGRITLERLEIARLDNDPDFPEHGALRVQMSGGK